MPAIIIVAVIVMILPIRSAAAPKEKLSDHPFTIAGDITQLALPVSAGGYSLYAKDYDGLKSLIFAGGSTLLVTYGLKYAIGRPRPYQLSDERGTSFPSGHTASAFFGAAYWQRRYGWYAGIPAYALAALTGYSRVHGNYHYWSDVAAGAAIGTAAVYIFTKPYNKNRGGSAKEPNTQISAAAQGTGVFVTRRF